MKVILLEDVKNIGKKFDTKEVTPGFARNFLFPSGKAVSVDSPEAKTLQAKAEKQAKASEAKEKNAESAEQSLQNATLKFTSKVSDKGHLFASITEKDIAKKVKEDFGITVAKDKIDMEHIKEVGSHSCVLHLSKGRQAKIKVEVSAAK